MSGDGHRCIVCGEERLSLFLDLGETALANAFLTQEELAAGERRYPLRVAFCECCSHVQLLDPVSPAEMFTNYLYVSSASDTLVAHLRDLAATVTRRQRLTAEDLVLDVGCNDGTLLAGFRDVGVTRVLGIDPAANLAALSRPKGIEVMTAFFDPDTAARIRDTHGPASVITMTNTFPHVPDLHGLMRAVDILLAPNGLLAIEAHYLDDLIDCIAFDTIYHEHVSYWALRPMQRLFRMHGFEVVGVERLPIHHGQLRIFVERAGRRKPEASVGELTLREVACGLDRLETFQAFARRVEENKRSLRTMIAGLRSEGRRIAGYGAPAKGNTLLGYLEIGPAEIEYICDRSPLKQGRFTPGMHIPVVPAERLAEDRPDYTVLFAWNFAEEIMAQQKAYLDRGGRFILPVPTVEVVP